MRKRKCAHTQLARKYKEQILRDIFSISQRDFGYQSLFIKQLKLGDMLFNKSNNTNDPRIALNAMDNDFNFAYGYMCTSVFLLDMINFGKDYLHKDSYIYPALFCFRMYLEIIIKLTIKQINGNKNTQSEITGHNLLEKWYILKKHYTTLTNDEEVLAVENLLKEISQIDPLGTSFRFPKKLNDVIHENKSPIGTQLIDVTMLRERFLQLYRFFEGLYDSVYPDNY